MISERIMASDNIGGLFGRKEITTSVDVITRENLLEVLGKALAIHNQNSAQIDYLYRYVRGCQPVLERVKAGSRPEICNRVVENHALEVALFTSGYFLGEPVTYVSRGEGGSEGVAALNDYMFFEDKASHDKDMSTWMSICGVAYRCVLPDNQMISDMDDSPFEIDTPDPRFTFVVYNSGFGHKRMLGAKQIFKTVANGAVEQLIYGYTADHIFMIEGGKIVKWEPHLMGAVPIIEYKLNMLRMGAFEPALPLLDSMNTLMSNRVDGVEQFVQSFLKFKNCDIDEEGMNSLKRLGAIVIKTVNGTDGDVSIVSQELNQSQVQSLVDYIYDQVLTICGVPTTTKGGSSTSDTGVAVILRDGWQQCEARAKDTELLFKRSEKEFLRLVLNILRNQKKDLQLTVAQVECKFTRRQHDAILSKTQALQGMLSAGISPEIAIASSGLFNDPMDVANQSKKYLEKWMPAKQQVVEQPESDENAPKVENE